ncbi:unnamed protein product [Fusarium graminearum]|uniref:Chromosome 1, complete genome n=1 Tax=Gibberella zeae (strain ATCC MYA-4620 / CBS 123657 / FGSC 9075 / NRRL 31084 / PH-1) TaxID=229533 RepID=A0A098DA44_GIBZE|nr:unnamed protein product [Fusarium graminearum]
MTIVRPTAFVILLASFFRKFGKTLYPGRDTIPYQWKGIVKGTLATGHIDGFPFAIHGHSVDLDDNGNISFRTQLVGYSSTSSSSGTRPSARRSSVLGRIQWLQNSDDGTEFWENGQQFQAPGGEDFAWIHILYEQPSILERVKEW